MLGPVMHMAKQPRLHERKQRQANDEAYLGYLARQVETPEQFEALVNNAEPKLRAAVRELILHKLKPEVQAAVMERSSE